MNNNHGVRNKPKPTSPPDSGGYGIFWDEYRSIEQSNPQVQQAQPDCEDGVNKKEDKAESEIQWLNDVGFTNIAKKIRARTEIDRNDDDMKIIAASLTRAQANAVRRRIDSLNEAIRQRKTEKEIVYPSDKANRSKRKDVRNLFNNTSNSPSISPTGQNVQQISEYDSSSQRRQNYKGQRFISVPGQSNKQNINMEPTSKDVLRIPSKSNRSSVDYSSTNLTTETYTRSQSMDFPKPVSPTTTRVYQQSPQEDNLVRRTSSQSRLIFMTGEEREKSLHKSSDSLATRRHTDAGLRTQNFSNNDQHKKSAAQEYTGEKTHRKTQSSDGLVNNYHLQGNTVIESHIERETPNKNFVPGGEKRLVIVDSKYINVSSVENTYNNMQHNNNRISPRTPDEERDIFNNARQLHMPICENKKSQSNYNLPAPPKEMPVDLIIEKDKMDLIIEKDKIIPVKDKRHSNKDAVPPSNGEAPKKGDKKEHKHKHKSRPNKPGKTPKRASSDKPKPVTDNQIDLKVNKTVSVPLSEPVKENGTCIGSDDNKSLSSLASLGSSDDLQISPSITDDKKFSTIYDKKIETPKNVHVKVESSRPISTHNHVERISTNGSHAETEAPRNESPGAGLDGDAKLNVDGSLGSPQDSPSATEAVSGPNFPPLPNFTLTREELGKTHIGDLADEDMVKVRSLALLELTALFDAYAIPMNRRKCPTKQKYKDQGMFGVPLAVLSQREESKKDPDVKAPRIFREMLAYLEKYGLKEEGILRIPGSTPRVKSFREECDKNNWDGLNWEGKKVSDISTCIKQFLRDLPIPLLSHEYQNTFTSVANLPTRKVQLQALNLLVLLLHPVHQETLKLLLIFLQKIVNNEAKNKMGLSNVAMIMAPNLFFQNNAKINIDEAQKAAGMTDVLRMLIKYQEILWTIPAFMVGQIRYLYEAGAKTKDPKAVRRIIAKRLRNEGTTTPRGKSSGSSGDELDEESYIVRVKAPSLNKQSMAIQLSEVTTAADVIAKFQWRRQNSQKEKDEIDHSRLSINRSSKKKDSNLELYLCEVGGNIGERRLDHDANLSAILKENPNAEWVLKGRVKR